MDVNDLRDTVDQAAEFAIRPDVLSAFGEVIRDEATWASVNRDVDAFLAERGLVPPDGLRIKPIPWPVFSQPSAEWEPFTIRLTLCKKVWVRGDDGMIREEQVCRGFEIVRHPIPGGPRG